MIGSLYNYCAIFFKMAGLGFAREQLEKQGWKEGKGLGKDEDGITKAIKLGVKNDTQGVGYKISDQFTFHWWDHVFNKTAKSITIDEDEDGVKVSKNDCKYLPISNQRPTKHSDKPLLYGRFVKASSSSTPTSAKIQSESDSDSEAEKDFSTEHAEDIVFKRCGGRTAHKGARHGLKLNGKLRRLEEHDKIVSSEPCSRSGSPDITKEHDLAGNTADLLKKLKSKKKKEFKSYSDSEECVKKKRDRSCENETPLNEEKVDRQRKKNRKDPKELNGDVDSNFGKKEKKRKNKDEDIEEEGKDLFGVESDLAMKKKNKKRKGNKDEEIFNKDNETEKPDLLDAKSKPIKKKTKRRDKNEETLDTAESENKQTNIVEGKNHNAKKKKRPKSEVRATSTDKTSTNQEPDLINVENKSKKQKAEDSEGSSSKKKKFRKENRNDISSEENQISKPKTSKNCEETSSIDKGQNSDKKKKRKHRDQTISSEQKESSKRKKMRDVDEVIDLLKRENSSKKEKKRKKKKDK